MSLELGTGAAGARLEDRDLGSGRRLVPSGRVSAIATERLRAFWELTKPGITRMVVLTTAAGFYAGSRGALDIGALFHTLLGTGLVAGGTNALNQVWERDVDALMPRTRQRPLPSGRLSLSESLTFAVSISTLGILYLGMVVGAAPALLVGLSLVSYIFLYTPLKRRTSLATYVGAVPGALPILAGWTAAGAGFEPAAWALFAVLFLWQVPHFLALGWLYRDEYRAAGLASLAGSDPTGCRTARRVIVSSAMLLAVSVFPSMIGLTGSVYLFAAVPLGLGFLGFGLRLRQQCDDRRARALFLASVAYLPLWILFLFVDKAG